MFKNIMMLALFYLLFLAKAHGMPIKNQGIVSLLTKSISLQNLLAYGQKLPENQHKLLEAYKEDFLNWNNHLEKDTLYLGAGTQVYLTYPGSPYTGHKEEIPLKFVPFQKKKDSLFIPGNWDLSFYILASQDSFNEEINGLSQTVTHTKDSMPLLTFSSRYNFNDMLALSLSPHYKTFSKSKIENGSTLTPKNTYGTTLFFHVLNEKNLWEFYTGASYESFSTLNSINAVNGVQKTLRQNTLIYGAVGWKYHFVKNKNTFIGLGLFKSVSSSVKSAGLENQKEYSGHKFAIDLSLMPGDSLIIYGFYHLAKLETHQKLSITSMGIGLGWRFF